MKIYKILFLASLLVFVLSACGGSKNNEVDSNKGSDSTFIIMKEDEPEEETVVGVMPEEVPNPENGHWRPPFKIKTEKKRYWGPNEFLESVFEFEILPDGKVRGKKTTDFKSSGFTSEHNQDGIWTVTYIERGESSQKVYVISSSEEGITFYIPDDCKYMWWLNNDPYGDMQNYKTSSASKITSVEIISDDQN